LEEAVVVLTDEHLIDFILESNRIERIAGMHQADLSAHRQLLSLDQITVNDVQAFVWEVAGAPLRTPGSPCIRVGNHFPPFGDDLMHVALEWLLINARSVPPIDVHDQFLWLHPFMDGNGRCSRVLWLWCMKQRDRLDWIKERPILHEIYYQHLERGNADQKRWWALKGYHFK
jgi:hypothetical protein